MATEVLPLAPTWTVALKMWEVAVTAPVVIGWRVLRMVQASSPPSARDRREFSRMGQEKVDAWYEAALATNQRLFAANLALTARFVRLGPELLTAGLTPVHRRVVANNRRLAARARP